MFNLSSLADIPPICAHGSCVTIGNFDGVHMGHRALIRRTCQKAVHHNLPCVVLTFWPHPLRVLAGQHAPPLLTTRLQRARLVEKLGVQVCLELPFDRALAALNPEEFVQQVLVPLNTRELVIGYDFTMGKGRQGTADVLAALGQVYNFRLEQLSPVIIQDAVVSSSRIRDLVRQGEVWDAQYLLSRFYNVSGTVIHGHGRGEGLGFPTANLSTPDVLLPRQGVYATWVSVGGVPHAAVTNVGVNPTFGGDKISVESFLLDADLNLYQQDIKVSFVIRLRDEMPFPNAAALTARIAQDVALARQVLGDTDGGKRLSLQQAGS